MVHPQLLTRTYLSVVTNQSNFLFFCYQVVAPDELGLHLDIVTELYLYEKYFSNWINCVLKILLSILQTRITTQCPLKSDRFTNPELNKTPKSYMHSIHCIVPPIALLVDHFVIESLIICLLYLRAIKARKPTVSPIRSNHSAIWIWIVYHSHIAKRI